MQYPYPVSRGELQGAADKERFLKAEQGSEEVINRKKDDFRWGHLHLGTDGSFNVDWGIGRVHVTDDFIGSDQTIPDPENYLTR